MKRLNTTIVPFQLSPHLANEHGVPILRTGALPPDRSDCCVDLRSMHVIAETQLQVAACEVACFRRAGDWREAAPNVPQLCEEDLPQRL